MKQETLKKIVELADGFEWRDKEGEDYEVGLPEKNTFLCSWCNHFRTNRWNQIYYPLLLRRAVNGINEIGEYEISLRVGYILLEIDDPKVEDLKDWDYDDYPKTEYLTPQEQAIEACLIELLEDKNEE